MLIRIDGQTHRQEESSSAPQHILKTFKQHKFNLGERESDWGKNTLIVNECIFVVRFLPYQFGKYMKLMEPERVDKIDKILDDISKEWHNYKWLPPVIVVVKCLIYCLEIWQEFMCISKSSEDIIWIRNWHMNTISRWESWISNIFEKDVKKRKNHSEKQLYQYIKHH